MAEEMIRITKDISIPEDELRFTASRSGGPGGQQVNKQSTRVTLWFDVANSPSLSDDQKELIRNHLPTRINKESVLRVVSQKHRIQSSNRDEAVKRFASLLGESLTVASPRRKRSIPMAAGKRRREGKGIEAALKQVDQTLFQGIIKPWTCRTAGEKRDRLEIARFYPADSFPVKIIAVLSIDRSAVY